MIHGVVDGFSEVVEWKIPDFFSIDETYIDSAPFSLAGYRWFLDLFPRSDAYRGYVSARLYLIDEIKTAFKTGTYVLGLKKAGGILEEVRRESVCNFTKDCGIGASIALWKIDDLQKRRSELVPSGALTVTCRIESVTPIPEAVVPKPEEVLSQRNMLVDLESLASDFSDLLSGDRKYDVTVDVQGKEYRAHRTVLAARSPVFRAMYEHDTAEAKSGLLTIPDCDPDTFGDFMKYLYTGKTGEVSFGTAYRLYATAEKYDVQHLKSFYASYLAQNLTVENVCDAVILADKYGDDLLMSTAQDFFNKNYCKVFLTPEWNALSSNTPRLSNKLLKEMANGKTLET